MTFPTSFANLAVGNEPASLLDAMFNIVGAQGIIPCTASGSTAITLTPNTGYYLPAAYVNYQACSFVATANPIGTVTVQLGALAFVNLYNGAGIQANTGDVISGHFYVIAFNGTLNSGSGGFQIVNSSVSAPIQPVQGGYKNLQITNGTTPDTQISVTCDQIMLGSATGGASKASNVSVTINTTTSGANGLDAGSIAAATWYSVWVISTGSTVAGIISVSQTAPTLPSGYVYYVRVGWVRTGASSSNLCRTLQYGNRAQYVVTPGSQTSTVVIIVSSGPAGGVFNPVAWNSAAIGNFVPPTAGVINGTMWVDINSLAENGLAILAPNSNYSGINISSNPPPVSLFATAGNVGSGALPMPISVLFSFVIESSNIYWALAGPSSASISLICLGWIDNL